MDKAVTECETLECWKSGKDSSEIDREALLTLPAYGGTGDQSCTSLPLC